MELEQAGVRNIGISAHIDSGKTTLTERILFYTHRIRAMHEVRGKDGVGATMDSMDLERERGITIQSAATSTSWDGHRVNIIDTPGHVDFTIEVERALRVIDGAILVLCAVGGVQSQSLTVDRQMRRYGVPCLAFINKLDRQGADPVRVKNQLRDKLHHNAVLMQLPLGLEGKHQGVIDLVTERAWVFEGPMGEEVVEVPIPDDRLDEVAEWREVLLDAASMFSDDLTEAILEDRIEVDLVKSVVREATIARKLTPVLLGTAYRNKGVQLLLDAVNDYLPAPSDRECKAKEVTNGERDVPLRCDPDGPMVALAFKLEEGRYGQVTYLRLYQGSLTKGDTIYNVRRGKKAKVGRLVRMHAHEMEDIAEASAGDIVALFGIDCRSGDTFTDGEILVSMTSMHVPEPVISYTVTNRDPDNQKQLYKALRRFTKEDPTFRVGTDAESGDLLVSGMGELHLDVYVERIRREYAVPVETSPPQVAYRETLSQRVDFDYTHRKQTGGSGQYGRVVGFLEPAPGAGYDFQDRTRGGVIPRDLVPSCDKGFRSMTRQGRLIGAPVIGVRVVLEDGNHHSVDSSDVAFQEAARGAWREVYQLARPIVLEPVMRVAVEGPSEYLGPIVATLVQRRGIIVGSTEEDWLCRIESEVPLAELFGYSTVLRSSTQGKAEFTMEFCRYGRAPVAVSKALVELYQARRAAGQKARPVRE